ncbi:uncharacterized protein LOC135837405 [Planococcus citri]|uniref:uncharacterized protein LOC135837405 n=1 Tax=Planococcus citri TaxID=170843 RepID=UPI0031F8F8E4
MWIFFYVLAKIRPEICDFLSKYRNQHDITIFRFSHSYKKMARGLSIVLGLIIVINILALLHKHEKITELDDVQLEILRKPGDFDIHKLAILYDIYDTSPDRLNETFLENPDLEKKLEAHFIKEAVDRSFLMIQTALSTYAVIVLEMSNQPSSRSAKTAVFHVLALLYYIPSPTVHNFFIDLLSRRFAVFFAVLKMLGANWIGYLRFFKIEHVALPRQHRRQLAASAG